MKYDTNKNLFVIPSKSDGTILSLKNDANDSLQVVLAKKDGTLVDPPIEKTWKIGSYRTDDWTNVYCLCKLGVGGYDRTLEKDGIDYQVPTGKTFVVVALGFGSVGAGNIRLGPSTTVDTAPSPEKIILYTGSATDGMAWCDVIIPIDAGNYVNVSATSNIGAVTVFGVEL